jgi:heme-degrading monooxygenase HmoA
MFIRSMYITADPAMVGPALDVIAKEAPGMFAEQDGYQGMGVFADRVVGKILVGSWWESEQAMNDSDARMTDRRAQMLAPFVATITIAGMENMAYIRPPSATTGGFRLQRMMYQPSMADMIVQVFRETGLARMKELPGFAGSSLLMDHAHGIGAVSVVFDDMAAMAASRSTQASIRHEAFSRLQGIQLLSLEEFEVVDIETPST